jgi:DNA-binding MarR family transcriptional regulator
LLKRLEAAGLVRRKRNPGNERQVIVALTDKGRSLQSKAGCLAEALVEASSHSLAELGDLNRNIRRLRDAIYASIGGDWTPTA